MNSDAMRRACLKDCTDAQRDAIEHVAGPLLVLAGPGSGKTRVITRRIGHLVASGVSPQHILAIAFTNKSAGEMRDRVEAMGIAAGAWLSTFHSFCARMIRAHAAHVGLTASFSIYDTADSLAAVKRAMQELEMDPSQIRPNKLARLISDAKNRLQSSEAVAASLLPEDLALSKVYTRYSHILQHSNAVDFDDLLLLMVRLLSDQPEIKATLQAQFQYILIDEYQDTNTAQYLIARRLADQHRNICVTGDPDQAIYGWRGADLKNILDFERDYPDAKVVRLEQNYRSTKMILKAADGLIAHNKVRKEKRLWTENPEGAPVMILRCEDEREEARCVAEEIEGLVRSGEFMPKDIAIFYRTNAQSRVLEVSLRGLGLPYAVVAGTEFYQRVEIKALLAYLRLVVNPDDDIGAGRVLNVPARRLGAVSVRRLRQWAAARGTSLLQALARGQEAGLRGQALTGAAAFAKVHQVLSALPRRPVAPIVEKLLAVTRFEEHLRALDKGEERLLNARELINDAAEYDRAEPEGDLGGFLERVALVSDTDKWDTRKGTITLMTLHAAKGLEFPEVYIVGLDQGLLPLVGNDYSHDLEEERRLFFVGITRAMKRLTISYAESRARFGERSYTEPSSFLGELPADAIKGPPPTAPLSQWERNQGRRDAAQMHAGRVTRRVRRSATEEIIYDGESPLDDVPFRVGDIVEHPSYGRGKVVELRGFGETLRVKVSFHSVGFKLLAPRYALLRRVL